MTIVSLEDNTTYLIDSNEEFNARYVVEHKLRNRLDYRKIVSTSVIQECLLNKESKYYNSGDAYDGVPLICKTGWCYKWADGRSASFR